MEIKDWSEHRPKNFTYIGGWVRNWFSNFAESPFDLDGIRWRSVENYYQAMKCNDPALKRSFSQVTPAAAKKMGRNVLMRKDWDEIKYEVMKQGLLAKFADHEWMRKLLDTEHQILIEWNNWNDKIWGVSIKDNLGANLLGLALMEVREYYLDRYLLKDTSLGKMLINKDHQNIL